MTQSSELPGSEAASPRARLGSARALGRFLALVMRALGGGDGLLRKASLAEPGTVFLVPAEWMPALAAMEGQSLAFLLPADAGLDEFAELIAGAGGHVQRLGSEPPPSAVPVVAPVLLPGAGSAQGPDALRLARLLPDLRPQFGRLRPLAIGAARSRTMRLGAMPAVRVTGSRPVAAAGPVLPADAAGHEVAAALERTAEAAQASLDAPGPPQRARPRGLRTYRAAMNALRPIAPAYLAWRARRGKEDPDRTEERYGRAGMTRDTGKWGWVHAASVGESVSALPLARELLQVGAVDHLLMTTGTTTSANLMATRLPERAVHQYVPLDVPAYVHRFLDHWHPDFALFVESELWPNMYTALAERGIPVAIVNGRISERSFRNWTRRRELAAHILSVTELCVAQSATYARRFAQLGAPRVLTLGNIKLDSPPLPFVEGELERLQGLTRLRPVWLAASTHEGEEKIVAETHIALRDRFPDLLTVLVPRHPERGASIAKMLEERWLATARRSTGADPRAAVDVYIADTIGELGLFYRLCPFALIGGSLSGTGGHNPVEAALLGCAILHGPDVTNFRDLYETFDEQGGAVQVAGTGELVRQLEMFLTNPATAETVAAAAKAVLSANAGSLQRVVAALNPIVARTPSDA